MYVVDASVWVARFLAEDINHDDSRIWLADVMTNGTKLIEPMLLLPEVAGPLARRTQDSFLSRLALDFILRTPGITLEPIDRESGLEAGRLAAELRLKGGDAVYVAAAVTHKSDLVTWDKTQLERASSRILVRRPSDLLAAQRGSA